MKIRIIGAGLIGTSMALGLKAAAHAVQIEDEDPEMERIAQNLIGHRGDLVTPDLFIVATPISSIISVVKSLAVSNPQVDVIDIGGLKSEVINEIERFPEIAKYFCSTHPMAGREIAGALAARGDLFEGRIWIITPTSQTSSELHQKALKIAKDLGASVVERDALLHDKAIAGISHLPQVVSSLLSLTLEGISQEDLALAGQGLKDVSRLAASDPNLWAELLHENRHALAPLLNLFAGHLNDLSTSLQNDDLRKTLEVLEAARINHRRIPGKHGGKKRDYWYLPIVIEDRPGQLAEIFDACAQVKVNVEDIAIEHTPGQESGLVNLALSREDASKLYEQLLKNNWKVHLPRESIG
jgi:prephenate dehydrogenase